MYKPLGDHIMPIDVAFSFIDACREMQFCSTVIGFVQWKEQNKNKKFIVDPNTN